MKSGSTVDWPAIRSRAAIFPDEAFDFVRDGLRHTAEQMFGETGRCNDDPTRHITGAQLCMGLRDYAIRQYGLLAGTVLRRWGVQRTDDFGTLVYAMIDKGEIRPGKNDSIDDFKQVFDFQEAFAGVKL